MLTWIIVVIEGDWRLLGILDRISAEKLNNYHAVSVWHLEGGKKEGMIHAVGTAHTLSETSRNC